MLVELFVPIAAFAVVFGIIFVVVTARNREKMALIEKGADPKDYMRGKPNVYSVLKWALLLIGVGIGVFIGSLLETYTQLTEEASYFGPILLFGGLGLLVAFLISKNANGDSE